MKHMLDKLAGAKGDDEGDHAQAKMQVLHDLRNMAMGMMGDRVKGKLPGHEMHSVEVSAPDEEGLQKGLGLAQHLTGPHDSATGPKGPPDSLNGDKMLGANSSMPSKLGHEAPDAGPQMSGHGQPDDSGAMEPDADDMYGDMDHDELDQHIEHLKKLKQAKTMRK